MNRSPCASTATPSRDGPGGQERPLTEDPTVFVEKKNGDRITITPGNTWEELVPYGLHVSVEP
jgi:hypothetical protein